MRDVIDDLALRWERGETVALATVVATFRSAPRPAGASMIVAPDRTVVGSVSGGCVEGDVYERALSAIETGEASLVRYGIADEDALNVGLTCGGILDIFTEVVSRQAFPELGAVIDFLRAGSPVAVATVIAHPDSNLVGCHLVVTPDQMPATAELGSSRLGRVVSHDALGLLATGVNCVLSYGLNGERSGEAVEVFVASFAPRPRMLVFGAIDFAAAVARLGSVVGYDVTVCDARPVFATPQRFPHADRVVVDWPHRYLRAEIDAGRVDSRTVVAVLTHDPKFDVPLLEVALRRPELAYVGAMGSRRTHDDRMSRLRASGVSDGDLAGLRSPIGLDLGALTPEETAVSIVAEMIASRSNATGKPLSETDGSIHLMAGDAPTTGAPRLERELV